MNKCSKCGTEFEGNCCPECGTWASGEKSCPKCGTKLKAEAKFCTECGYSFEGAQYKPEKKKIPVATWIKAHLKLVIALAAALVLTIVLACSIPACIAAKTNGTYYKLQGNGEIDKETYFILKSGKWEDEDGLNGTYKKEDDNIRFYIKLFGENEEADTGTLKDYVLTVSSGTFISEKHQHIYGEWKTDKEATCIRDGSESRACACGVKETNKLPATGKHSYEWVVTSEATCTREGNKDYTCKGCGDVRDTEVIVKTAHIYGEWTVNKEATCTEAGSQTHTCTVCRNKETQTIEALGHKYGDWEVIKEANEEINGLEIRTCFCGAKEERILPATGTSGLKYQLNEDKQEYTLSGLGNATSTVIYIPNKYNGLPVTSIGGSAFKDCKSLTSVTIPNSVTSIDWDAFRGCTSLSSITIPDSVTSIGRDAFSGCTSLASITIPDSVTEIGTGAFINCTALASITIPDSVTEINESAFANTAYYNNKQNWDNGALYIGKHLINVESTISGKFNIKEGTLTVADYAFNGCKSLTSITIPDSITEIGSYAFHGCTSLTGITIPDSVTVISYRAFFYCTSLTSITIPNGVTTIDHYAFVNCTSLTSITIPDSVTTIGSYTFDGCTALTSITIPDSVTYIGNDAFRNTAYYNNKQNWDNGVLYIGKHLIKAENTVSGKFSIKDSTLTVAGSAFKNCKSLTSITIPDSVTHIGGSAFDGCTSLKNITIPDKVISIGSYAFDGCTSLASITIPDSVTSIGSWAFSSCTSLTSITFKGTKAQWNAINKNYNWDYNTGNYTVHCTDGDIKK